MRASLFGAVQEMIATGDSPAFTALRFAFAWYPRIHLGVAAHTFLGTWPKVAGQDAEEISVLTDELLNRR